MGETRTLPLNRVEAVFPGTTGYISVKNTGTSGIKLAFGPLVGHKKSP